MKEEKLTKADPKFPDVDVDVAAKEIGEILRKTVVQGAKDVGEYILKKFFKDDVELAQSHSPSKLSSFRTLSERCGTPELPVGKTYLNTAVGVAIMCRRLLEKGGTPTYNDLPPSHQVALLPLHEPEKVEEFAKRVKKDKLTVLTVKEDVRKVVAKRKKSGKGRKPLSPVLKAVDRTFSLFEHESGGKLFTNAQVGALDAEQKRDTLKKARALIASLVKLERQLKTRPAKK